MGESRGGAINTAPPSATPLCLLSAGKLQSLTKSCNILPEMPTAAFENTDGFYKHGMPPTGTVMGVSCAPQPRSPTPALWLQRSLCISSSSWCRCC